VIGVQHDRRRPRKTREPAQEFVVDPLRQNDRQARVNAQPFQMRNRREWRDN